MTQFAEKKQVKSLLTKAKGMLYLDQLGIKYYTLSEINVDKNANR